MRMDNAQGTMQVDDDVVVVIPILIIMELIIIAMERICVTYLRTIFAYLVSIDCIITEFLCNEDT